MRVFVTGAGGHIGSAVVPELIQAGHEVVGLARSEASAAAVEALGATVRRGELKDLGGLREAAAEADAVIHLAFDHASIPLGGFAEAAAADYAVIQAFGEALAGSGKALIGVGLADSTSGNPRAAAGRALLGFAERDVRSILVAVPSVTHSARDRHGFIPMLINTARATGVSGYVGDGANRWPAGHTLDVARVFRLAVEKAPPGTQLVAAAEAGIPVREIAEAIARHLEIPTASIPAERAAEHFKGFPFVTLDVTLDNTSTRQLLGWEPVHPDLIADLDEGHYFATATASA